MRIRNLRLINATTALGAVAIAAAAGLSACDAGEKADAASGYCQELRSAKTFFQSLQGSDPHVAALGEAFDRMHELAGIAPPAVTDDWAMIDHEVDAIEKAMKDAGLTFDDLAAIQDGEVPDGVDLDKLTAVGTEFEALSGGDFDAASAHIAEHAKKTCGFTLPLS